MTQIVKTENYTEVNAISIVLENISKMKKDAKANGNHAIYDFCLDMDDIIAYMSADSARLDKLERSGLLRTTDLRSYIDRLN